MHNLVIYNARDQGDEIKFLKNNMKEREMYWKNKLENERKIHEESLRESVTTFSDLEEKMREYEEISVEIKQISAEISARNSLTVSAAESIKSEVSKSNRRSCYVIT